MPILANTILFIESLNIFFLLFQDYLRMLKEFPMLYDNFTVPYPEWNHVDFMWAIDTDIYLFPHMLENMEAAEKLEASEIGLMPWVLMSKFWYVIQ